MGGKVKIWNPVEIAEQAKNDYASQIFPSLLSIDPSLSLPQMTPLVINLCKDMFKTWSSLGDSCFKVEKISGGITNLLLKVSVKQGDSIDDIITVRLYGPNTEHIIDRFRELQAIKYITAAGFGAEWLGIFGNGIVQSFINAHTLAPSDMREPKLVAKIAKQLQKFHGVEIPGSKEPQLWNDIWKFFEKASVLEFGDSEKQKTYKTVSFKEVHDEIYELQVLSDRLKSPVIFSHNDLLSGNIMINHEEDKLYFIDYEYASYNYRGYDIGNHFAEYAGFECDYSLYPNMNEQYHFFRHYLQPDRPQEVSENDLKTLYVEVNTYALASHLFWSLWGLIQAKMSPIDFDYLGYFFLRYNEYKRQKEKLVSMALSYLLERNE
ncbi:putative ethanolamine kinase [Medicago truncatula]|uniref:ethanolamine kinase n=1 Tax=Medicago truncatula TaxID=3880 RepID=A0A072V7D3_MEDTR|nr:probable ethanolamine kinase [Medicago truncatula]KEH37939.1 choline/ethanolamine kinase [Medicago truncatula]RHN74149.1 putative ethanolamine kinase [Medicago truncatula]